MKKIAILSDIHSNAKILKAMLKDLEKENIDEYIFCGDYITDGFENNEVLDIIKNLSTNVVLGNREISVINYDGSSWEESVQWGPSLYAYKDLRKDNLDYIKSLPLTKIIEVENVKICFSHINPVAKKKNITENSEEHFDEIISKINADVFLFGHSHIPFAKEYRNKIFINPGSVSYTKDSAKSTCGILTISNEITYKLKMYNRDINQIKKYYTESNYYKKCPEWSNILIHSYQDGIDHCSGFVDFMINQNITNVDEVWSRKFNEYMNLKELEIH